MHIFMQLHINKLQIMLNLFNFYFLGYFYIHDNQIDMLQVFD